LIVEEFSLLFNDHAPLVFNPSDPKLLQKPLRIKEGATYRIKIKFYAQHDVVLGLKYLNFVYKLGIRGVLLMSIPYLLSLFESFL
jgi:Rho GDP-dissociation inhibitor